MIFLEMATSIFVDQQLQSTAALAVLSMRDELDCSIPTLPIILLQLLQSDMVDIVRNAILSWEHILSNQHLSSMMNIDVGASLMVMVHDILARPTTLETMAIKRHASKVLLLLTLEPQSTLAINKE